MTAPQHASKSRVFAVHGVGGGGGASPSGLGPPSCASRSRIFTTAGPGGGGGASPSGLGPPIHASKSRVFTVLPLGMCGCGITDTFGRTTSPGDLGRSDSGHLWENFGSGFTSFVDGSRANLVQTEGWFLPYWHIYADVTVEFEFSGEGQFELNVAANNWDAVARHTPSEGGFLGHQWLMVGDPAFNEELVGFAWASGVVYRMHLVVDAAGGHLNAWEASSTEPLGWMVEVLNGPFTNTGEIRIINGNPNGNPYGPIYVSRLDTVDVNACLFDDFGRDLSGTWGDTTPTGVTWDTPFEPSGHVVLDVVSGIGGEATIDTGWGVIQRLPASDPWIQPTGFTMTYDFLVGPVPGAGEQVSVEIYDEDFLFDLYIAVSSEVGTGRVYIEHNGTSDTLDKDDWVADTWYRIKLEFRPDALVRVKVWPRDDTEPVGWLLEVAGTSAAVSGYLEWAVDTDSATNDPYVFTFRNLTFNGCPAT